LLAISRLSHDFSTNFCTHMYSESRTRTTTNFEHKSDILTRLKVLSTRQSVNLIVTRQFNIYCPCRGCLRFRSPAGEVFARISLPEEMSSIPRIVINAHSAHTLVVFSCSDLLMDDLSMVQKREGKWFFFRLFRALARWVYTVSYAWRTSRIDPRRWNYSSRRRTN